MCKVLANSQAQGILLPRPPRYSDQGLSRCSWLRIFNQLRTGRLTPVWKTRPDPPEVLQHSLSPSHGGGSSSRAGAGARWAPRLSSRAAPAVWRVLLARPPEGSPAASSLCLGGVRTGRSWSQGGPVAGLRPDSLRAAGPRPCPWWPGRASGQRSGGSCLGRWRAARADAGRRGPGRAARRWGDPGRGQPADRSAGLQPGPRWWASAWCLPRACVCSPEGHTVTPGCSGRLEKPDACYTVPSSPGTRCSPGSASSTCW